MFICLEICVEIGAKRGVVRKMRVSIEKRWVFY